MTSHVTLYTLTIDHRHGQTTRVFRSEEGARDALAVWVRQWWPVEFGARDKPRYSQAEFDALPNGEAISEYFENIGDEYYWLDEAELEG